MVQQGKKSYMYTESWNISHIGDNVSTNVEIEWHHIMKTVLTTIP